MWKESFSNFSLTRFTFLVIFVLSASCTSRNENTKLTGVDPKAEKIEVIGQNVDCDLSYDICSFQIPDLGEVTVELKPRPVIVQKAIKFVIKVANKMILPEAVDLQGVNLNMGYIRPTFQESSTGIFEANIVLPTCEEKTMKWKSLLLFKGSSADEAKKGVYFFFTSSDPNL